MSDDNIVGTATTPTIPYPSSAHVTIQSPPQQQQNVATKKTTAATTASTASTASAGVARTTGDNISEDSVDRPSCEVIETPLMNQSQLPVTDQNNNVSPPFSLHRESASLLSPSKPPSSLTIPVSLLNSVDPAKAAYNGDQPHSHEEQTQKDEAVISEGTGRGRRHPLTFEECVAVFNLPVARAAEALGVSRPTISKVLRARGIRRWPYRRLRADRRLNAWGPEAAAAAAVVTLASASLPLPPPLSSSSAVANPQNTGPLSLSTTSSLAPSSSPSLSSSPSSLSPSSPTSSSSSSSSSTSSSLIPLSSLLPENICIHHQEKQYDAVDVPRHTPTAVVSSSAALNEVSIAPTLDPSLSITISHIFCRNQNPSPPHPTIHSNGLPASGTLDAGAPDSYPQPFETHTDKAGSDKATYLPEYDDNIFDSNRRWFSGQWTSMPDVNIITVSDPIESTEASRSQPLLLDSPHHLLTDHAHFSDEDVLRCDNDNDNVCPVVENDSVDALLRLTDAESAAGGSHKGDTSANRAVLSSPSWSTGELHKTDDGDVYFAFCNASDES